jgi:GMP synthase (glutamine-hydrolysing)
MRPLLIIQTGHAPAPIRSRLGDFPHWFRLGLGLPREAIRVVDVQAGEAPPDADDVCAALVTGSSAMVTDGAAWSERTALWLAGAFASGLPLLGVCYGHQLMAHALGGRVGALPAGREIGTQWIEACGDADDPLVKALPQRFAAHTTHQQAVLECPEGARVLARSAADPHQIIRYGPDAVSFQFHPEFSAAAMRAYIQLRGGTLRDEGRAPGALLGEVTAAPWGRRLLRRFVRGARERRRGL